MKRPKLILLGIIVAIALPSQIVKGDTSIISNPNPPIKSKSISVCSVTQAGNCIDLYFNLDAGDVTVSVENETGDIVYETNTTATSGSSLSIDTSTWESGSYTLTVTSATGIIYTTDIGIL